MSELTRRELLVALGVGGFLSQAVAQQVHQAVQSLDQGDGYLPQFFTAPEYATLRKLADFVIPADETSKGAIDAGAGEFIDYICSLSSNQAGIFRDGLNWIDIEMQRRMVARSLLLLATSRSVCWM